MALDQFNPDVFSKCIRVERLCKLDLNELAKQNREPMSYNTLRGIFADYRAEHCSRKQLVEAIHDWQVTAAKELTNGRN